MGRNFDEAHQGASANQRPDAAQVKGESFLGEGLQ
jgi:hypothetical protein